MTNGAMGMTGSGDLAAIDIATQAGALSALDIGLWDIAGKAAKLPLYKLWGAAAERIPCYGSGGWGKYAIEDLIQEAKKYVGRGCRYYKMKIHHPDPNPTPVDH